MQFDKHTRRHIKDSSALEGHRISEETLDHAAEEYQAECTDEKISRAVEKAKKEGTSVLEALKTANIHGAD